MIWQGFEINLFNPYAAKASLESEMKKFHALINDKDHKDAFKSLHQFLQDYQSMIDKYEFNI